MKRLIEKTLKSALFIAIVIIYQCPIRLIFGIECPGCGLTAAILYAIRLDFKSAFSCHPLFSIPLITVGYLLIRKYFSLPKKVEITIGLLFIIAFIICYVLKMTKLYC